MAIKNYTSTVPMVNSIARIEHRLVQGGVTIISKDYEDSKPKGMIFQISNNGMPMTFKLPAKADKVFEWMRKRRSKPPTKAQIVGLKAQADRTAWKILSDWIDIQISLIELDQAEAIEIFLPYAYDGNTDQTFFEKLKESNFKLLSDGS